MRPGALAPGAAITGRVKAQIRRMVWPGGEPRTTAGSVAARAIAWEAGALVLVIGSAIIAGDGVACTVGSDGWWCDTTQQIGCGALGAGAE